MKRMERLGRREVISACSLALLAFTAIWAVTWSASHKTTTTTRPAHAPTGGVSVISLDGFGTQPQLQKIDLAAVAPTPFGSVSTPAARQSAAVSDLGGPVQNAPRIYVVFVGSAWLGEGKTPTADAQKTLTFFTDLTGSQYSRGLQQYRGASTDPKLVAAWVDPVSLGTELNPAADVASVMQQESIPAGNQTQVVAVYPPGYTFTAQGESGLGAFHAVTAGVTFSAVSYSVTIPNSLTHMLSHEYAETVTDPLVTSDGTTSPNPAFVAAGDTPTDFNELADLCETRATDSALAAYFDRASSQCVIPPLS